MANSSKTQPKVNISRLKRCIILPNPNRIGEVRGSMKKTQLYVIQISLWINFWEPVEGGWVLKSFFDFSANHLSKFLFYSFFIQIMISSCISNIYNLQCWILKPPTKTTYIVCIFGQVSDAIKSLHTEMGYMDSLHVRHLRPIFIF